MATVNWGWRKRLAKRHSLYEAQGGKCHWCGVEMLFEKRHCNAALYATFEHLVPVSQGGRDTDENVVLVHRVCNR